MISYARIKLWTHRTEFFAALVKELPYEYLYDFGCGYCEIKEYVGVDKKYIGVDALAYKPDITICNLNSNFPKLLGTFESRMAIAMGLFEYLPNPYRVIKTIMENFSFFAFSYIIYSEPFNHIIPSKIFIDEVVQLCRAHEKKCSITKMDNDPWEKKGILQDILVISDRSYTCPLKYCTCLTPTPKT